MSELSLGVARRREPVVVRSEDMLLDRWRGSSARSGISTAGAWQLRIGEASIYLARRRSTPPQWKIAGMAWVAGESFRLSWFERNGAGPESLRNPSPNRAPEIQQMMRWLARAELDQLATPTRQELIETIKDALDRYPLVLR